MLTEGIANQFLKDKLWQAFSPTSLTTTKQFFNNFKLLIVRNPLFIVIKLLLEFNV